MRLSSLQVFQLWQRLAALRVGDLAEKQLPLGSQLTGPFFGEAESIRKRPLLNVLQLEAVGGSYCRDIIAADSLYGVIAGPELMFCFA